MRDKKFCGFSADFGDLRRRDAVVENLVDGGGFVGAVAVRGLAPEGEESVNGVFDAEVKFGEVFLQGLGVYFGDLGGAEVAGIDGFDEGVVGLGDTVPGLEFVGNVGVLSGRIIDAWMGPYWAVG